MPTFVVTLIADASLRCIAEVDTAGMEQDEIIGGTSSIHHSGNKPSTSGNSCTDNAVAVGAAIAAADSIGNSNHGASGHMEIVPDSGHWVTVQVHNFSSISV